MTAFALHTLELWPGMKLELEGNGKITRAGGSYAVPVVNSLSLPAIACCPGSTPSCQEACYTAGMPPALKAAHARNAAAIGSLLLSSGRAYRAAQILGEWIAANCEASGFRWHVSGDVMHQRHASWIADVCDASLGVSHWIYTHTLECVVQLCCAENLVVNVSADADNYSEARRLAAIHGVRLTYLTRDGKVPDDLPEGSVIFPDYGLRGRSLNDPTDHPWWRQLPRHHRRAVCPPDFFGQSEHLRCGPCTKCLKPLEAAK